MNATTSRHARFAARAGIQGLACVAALAGCGKKAAPGAPPPPQVTVLTVQRQTIPGQYEWVAQAAASKSVQVRAQVSGVIVDRPYVEGTDVPKGKVLFRIDPRTYQANYESAKARLAESEAQFANAERTLNRLKAARRASGRWRSRTSTTPRRPTTRPARRCWTPRPRWTRPRRTTTTPSSGPRSAGGRAAR